MQKIKIGILEIFEIQIQILQKKVFKYSINTNTHSPKFD